MVRLRGPHDLEWATKPNHCTYRRFRSHRGMCSQDFQQHVSPCLRNQPPPFGTIAACFSRRPRDSAIQHCNEERYHGTRASPTKTGGERDAPANQLVQLDLAGISEPRSEVLCVGRPGELRGAIDADRPCTPPLEVAMEVASPRGSDAGDQLAAAPVWKIRPVSPSAPCSCWARRRRR